MDPLEQSILIVADITREAEAISRAALDRDFEEARFRATLLLEKATVGALTQVAGAAARALDRLGPSGALPNKGYGEAILGLASAVDVLWFDQR